MKEQLTEAQHRALVRFKRKPISLLMAGTPRISSTTANVLVELGLAEYTSCWVPTKSGYAYLRGYERGLREGKS